MISVPVVAWLGPVNLTQVKGASVPGAATINVTCTGDGSPSCTTIAEGYTGVGGRKLPGMLASKGMDPADEVVLGAFSAGGSIAKRLAMDPADRAQIRAILLADATYTTTEGAPEGFVRFALDAAKSKHLFVATASSSPNKNWPSGAQTLDMIRAEVEKRGQQKFIPGAFPGVDPQPAKVWRLGNVLFADYGSIVSHGEHATLLAPQIWKNILLPWLAGNDPGRLPVPPGPRPPPAPPGGGDGDPTRKLLAFANVAAFLTAAAVGFGAVRLFRKRRA